MQSKQMIRIAMNCVKSQAIECNNHSRKKFYHYYNGSVMKALPIR
jgi:hypothetical protein